MNSAKSAIPQDIMAAVGFGVVVMVGDLDEGYIGLAARQPHNRVEIAENSHPTRISNQTVSYEIIPTARSRFWQPW